MPIPLIQSVPQPFPQELYSGNQGISNDSALSTQIVPRNPAFDKIQWDRAYPINQDFQPNYNPAATQQYEQFTPTQGNQILNDLNVGQLPQHPSHPLSQGSQQTHNPTTTQSYEQTTPSPGYRSLRDLETGRSHQQPYEPAPPGFQPTYVPPASDSLPHYPYQQAQNLPNPSTQQSLAPGTPGPRSIMDDIRLDLERHEAVKNYLADPSTPPNLPIEPHSIYPQQGQSYLDTNQQFDGIRWMRDWRSPNNFGVTPVQQEEHSYYGISPAFYNAVDPRNHPLSFGNDHYAGFVKFGLKTEYENFPSKAVMQAAGDETLLVIDKSQKFLIAPTAEFYFRNKFTPYADQNESGLLGFLPPFDLAYKSEIEVAYQDGEVKYTPKAMLRVTSADYRLGGIDVMGSLWGGLNQSTFTGNHFLDSKNSLNFLLGIRTDSLLPQSAFYGKLSRQWNYPSTDAVADTREVGFVVGLQGLLSPEAAASLKDTPLPRDLNGDPLAQNGDAFFFGTTSKVGIFLRDRDLEIPFNNKVYGIDDHRVGAFAEISLGAGDEQNPSLWNRIFQDTKIIPTLAYNFGDSNYFAPGLQLEKTIPTSEGKLFFKVYYERDTLAEELDGEITAKPAHTFGFKVGFSL